MKVTAPDGAVYGVRRRWWPWRWKARTVPDSFGFDTFADLGGATDLGGAIAGLLIGLLLALLAPIILFLLITGIEWILLLVLLPVAVAARVVFGRHWTIDVTSGDREWAIDGGTWRESQTALQQIAAQIERGDSPLPDTVVA